MDPVTRNRALKLVSALAAVAVVSAPIAAADPGSPSYTQGEQAIHNAAQQGPLHVSDLTGYCNTLLAFTLRSGQIARVDSPADFIAGCQDEGHSLLPPQ